MLEVPPICLSFMLQKTIMPLSHPIMVGRYNYTHCIMAVIEEPGSET